jgi:hypothetical protein
VQVIGKIEASRAITPRRAAKDVANVKVMRATLFFGGRKYGDYNFSSHGNQKIQADAWGVNPVGEPR